MDKEISSKERDKSKIWQILKWIVIIAIAAVVFYFGRNALRKTGTMDDFYIAQVERGDIQNTLTATGVVKPSYEREINAPVNTEIKNVVLPKGTVVKKVWLEPGGLLPGPRQGGLVPSQTGSPNPPFAIGRSAHSSWETLHPRILNTRDTLPLLPDPGNTALDSLRAWAFRPGRTQANKRRLLGRWD